MSIESQKPLITEIEVPPTNKVPPVEKLITPEQIVEIKAELSQLKTRILALEEFGKSQKTELHDFIEKMKNIGKS